MERKHKLFLKLNLMSLFFVAISFVSITLAWFAYSGLSSATVDVDIKAWNIEFKNGEQVVSNEIVISLSDIHPGMDTEFKDVDISNLGDSDAQISYNIKSVRVLNEVLNNNSNEELIDKLSHDYPFHINMNLDKDYALAHGDSGKFNVSISWPLDSNNDELDSEWGNKAYQFYMEEQQKKQSNPDYEIRSSLEVVIEIKAEQMMITNETSDTNYNLGEVVLYDVINNKVCDQVSAFCLKTYVIDSRNKVGDTTVKLLPDLNSGFDVSTYENYTTTLNEITKNWKVTSKPLEMSDILSVISKDVNNSVLVRNNLSDVIIGNLNYQDRLNNELNYAITNDGYYKFNNSNFSYLVSNSCYWINNEYNDGAFQYQKIDDNNSKYYKGLKTDSCKIVPIIIVSKSNLIV